MKLFADVPMAEMAGWGMIAVGGLILVVGTCRFVRVLRMLRKIGIQAAAGPQEQQTQAVD